MSSQHTRLRALVRAELRSVLADLLAALPPVGPVAPPVALPSPRASEALGAALDAWEAFGGTGRGISAAAVVCRATEHPEEWSNFCDAVERVIPGAASGMLAAHGRVTAHGMGNVLKQLRGRVAGGRALVGDLDRTTKIMRWRVARVEAHALARPRAEG